MIDRISLVNFQSHRDTTLELSPGINTIIGSSDSGKSAILRALYWVIDNRPTGTGFVSFWDLTDKGKMKSATGVTLERGKESVSRFRSETLNGYKINKTVLEAMKTDVPESVSRWLNIESVNVQKQLDAPFLLSASAGEVARFFNEVIRLNVIDRALSMADKQRRDNSGMLKLVKDSVGTDIAYLEHFNWVETAETLVQKAVTTAGFLKTASEGRAAVDDIIEAIEEAQKEVDAVPDLSQAENLIEKITRNQQETDEAQKEHTAVRVMMNSMDLLNKVLRESPDGVKAGQLIAELVETNSKREETAWDIKRMNDTIEDIEGNVRTRDAAVKKIKKLEAQMPETCPLCGQPWEENHAEISH